MFQIQCSPDWLRSYGCVCIYSPSPRHLRLWAPSQPTGHEGRIRACWRVTEAWAAIPGVGGRGDTSPNIFGEGDSYGSVPPNIISSPCHIHCMGHWLLHAPVLYALEYTKSKHTFSKISQDTQETPSTHFPITCRPLYLIKLELIVHSSQGAHSKKSRVRFDPEKGHMGPDPFLGQTDLESG